MKIFPGIIVRRHHTDQKQIRLLKEQCAEWKKVPLQYCCNQVWKLVGRFHGMLYLSAKRLRSLIWWENPYERRFGQPFKGAIIPFGSLIAYYPISAKDQSRIHEFERRSYLDCSSVTLCTRVEFVRVTYWLQTLRSWKRWAHQKSTLKDSMRRK